MPTDTPTAIPVGHHGVGVILVPRRADRQEWMSIVAPDGKTLIAQLHIERDAAAIAALGGEPEPRQRVELYASLTEIGEWYAYLSRLADVAPAGMVERLCQALEARWSAEHGGSIADSTDGPT